MQSNANTSHMNATSDIPGAASDETASRATVGATHDRPLPSDLPLKTGLSSTPRDGDPHKITFDPWAGRPTAALMKITASAQSAQNQLPADRNPQHSRRTAKTEEQYRERVRSLYRQSAGIRTTDPQNPVEPSPIDVVQDLIDSASGENPVRARASWALYRSALLWHLADNRLTNDAYETAYAMLADTKLPPGVLKAPKRAKATFRGDDFGILINALLDLKQRGANWGSRTAYWLQAGVAAGARTGEWMDTSWLDRDKLQLLIPNSKRKAAAAAFTQMANASMAGSTAKSVYELATEIDDHDFDEEDLLDDRPQDEIGVTGGAHRVVRIDRNDALYVDLHLAAIERHAISQSACGTPREVAFRRYYEMVRRTLRQACEIAFKGKRYYRLYHTRSQFSADRKVDHALNAVSGMMGHTNTRTTMSSYGSRADGLKGRKAQSNLLAAAMGSQRPTSDKFQHTESSSDTPV